MIYIISNTPYPNGWASTTRIKCYAKALKDVGVDCRVIVFRPTETRENSRGNNRTGVDDGIPYMHIGPLYIPKSSILLRIFDVWSLFLLYLFLLCHLKKGDSVFFYHDPFWFVNQFIKLVHRKGAKYMVELCEYPNSATIVDNEKTEAKSNKILNKYFPLYDGIIAISEELRIVAKQHASPDCDIIKIPILVEFEKKNVSDLSNQTDKKFIFHSGSLTEKKDGFLGMLKAYAKAYPRLQEPLYFISTGDYKKSPIRNDIDEVLNNYNIRDKVLFIGYLSDRELLINLQKATLVIINKYRTKQNKYCFSTKLGEYLCASKPVIITRYGEAMNWVSDRETAYIVEPEDVDQLSDVIVQAINNPNERYEIARKGHSLCKKSFDYRQYSNRLKNFFTK